MTDQPNFFEKWGDGTTFSHERARRRVSQKRSRERAPQVPVTAQEKELRRQQLQTKRWRHERRGRIREAMEKAEHHGWRELTRILRQLTIDSPSPLIDYVRGATWLHQADLDTRYLVLSIIGTSIIRMRERAGLEPIDDALPGEPDTVFQIIRKLIIPERAQSPV